MNRETPWWTSDWLAKLQGQAKQELASAVQAGRTLARIEVPIANLDLVEWLCGYPDQVQLFCMNRSRTLSVAALGVADRIRSPIPISFRDGLDEIRKRLSALPAGVRYYGGFEFTARQHGDPGWDKVGSSMFILPAVELIQDEQGSRLAMNLPTQGPAEEGVDHWIRVLSHWAPDPITESPPIIRGRVDVPDRDAWAGQVAKVLDLIERGEVRKVVLARRTDILFQHPLDPRFLLRGMTAGMSTNYVFFFNYAGELAFLGSTPEQLYHRQGRQVFSEALAGTRPRGSDPVTDQALADELMTHPKLVQEHQLVESHVAACLAACCEQRVERDGPSVLSLPRLQHRVTRFSGRVGEAYHDADLLERLHPTPAVAGDPVQAALEVIRQVEPFDRGWYAGPIGWVSGDEVEFAVALRCGLLAGPLFRIFAGAGLVAQSRAEDEWTEINIKMDHFLKLINPG
ncbi:MAG: isochorismate synthase [Kiritimatiellae bacterium]|nr:isochorismate synthase [Kiritimatiellia bacterium]